MRLVSAGDSVWAAMLAYPCSIQKDEDLLQRLLRLGQDPEWWKR